MGEAEEVFRSQERQTIIAALKDAGVGKDGAPNPMSTTDIMAVTERSDRGAIKSLLHKMRTAGEVVSPRPGYHALPGGDPLNAVDAVDGQDPSKGKYIDKTGISASKGRQRRRQRASTGSESVDGALRPQAAPRRQLPGV